MSLNSSRQRDDNSLMGKAHRTVLPPSKYMPGSDSNQMPSSVVENNKLPSLVPEIILSSLQKGHRSQLSQGTTLEQPEVPKILTQSDTREELSPVRRVNHRIVLPKTLPDANSGQSHRRVVLPYGKSETSGSRQGEQPDSRLSASSHTMTKQAKEEELEFLKLKLRYMQNDIEFKRKQIDSAMMSKLRNISAATKWKQSQKNALVQSGVFQGVQQVQIPSSGVFPAQQRMFYHKSPASTWAASEVSIPRVKAAASMFNNCSDLQARNIPSIVPAANNRSVVGSKPLVTGSNKSCLTTSSESNISCVAAGIYKSDCESKKSSLVTDSDKSSMAAGSKKYGLITESISSVPIGSNSSSAACLVSSQMSPLNQWEHTSSSADVRTVYPSCSHINTASSHINTAHIKNVNAMSPQQSNFAHNQTAHKKKEQATSYPADPNVVLYGLNKDMPLSNAETGAGSLESVFGRLGNQRISEMPKIVHESPDKRLVVAPTKVNPAVVPAASVASDMTRTIDHTTSLAAETSETSPNCTLYTSIDTSHVSNAKTHSDGDPPWKPHSVTPANKYRFMKNPSCTVVDIANTSLASTVNSVILPSALHFTSSNMDLNLDAAAARGGSPANRLSIHCPKLNIPTAVETVNKYKLKRVPPVSEHQAAPQSFPIKMLLKRSSVTNQAEGKGVSQSAKNQHQFVSKYSLIKAPSHMPAVADIVSAYRVNSVVSPSSLFDSSRISALSVQPAMAAATRRASQGSRLTFRNPNLKIHTAAKLVSKYKLKRLSPTLTPQTPPQFYNRLLYKQSSSVHNHTDNKTPGQYNRNQLKLDRRLMAVNPANPKVSYKKCGDEYSNKFTVLTHKHKIDRRPEVSQSPIISGASLSLNKFAIDKRRKLDRALRLKADTPVCAGKNVLDGRVSKTGLFKLQAMARQLAVDRRWAGPRAVAAGKLRSGAQLSSKYSWRKPCLPAAAQSSRFKWSRSNVQAQNEAWQQLRQKLQLLLMKKHRHSRYSFCRYPAMAAASRVYNRRAPAGDDKTHLITIDGVTYSSSTSKLTRTRRLSSKSALKRVAAPAGCGPPIGSMLGPQRQSMKLISLRGVHFHVDQSGKKLCRTQPATAPRASAGVKRSSSSHTDVNAVNFANRVIHRSIAIATAKYRKNNKKTKTPHCKFFSRFGKCHRGDNCPYVHDPEKVAVCTRFLRGRCDVKDCPFSHKASVNKMPVCLFYLRGSCSRDSCPYLHVRVNPSAPVCKDFRSGFCALGEKCKKIHSHVCPSFAMTGVCSRSGTCMMLHRASRKDQEASAQDKSLIKKPIEPRTDSTSHAGKMTITPNFTVPLAAQPSFISLGITPTVSVSSTVTASVQSVTSLGTTATPSFISLDSTPSPSISLDSTPTPSFISLDSTPTQSFISLETTPTPSFIALETTPKASVSSPVTTLAQLITSLETTPTPSFISLQATPSVSVASPVTTSSTSLVSTPTPHFISLRRTRTPSYISLESTSTPSFISFETRQQNPSSEKPRSNPSVRKLEVSGLSADSGPGQDVNATRPLLNIRPSFMTKKVPAQNS